jgi:hypothetical protein
MYVTNARQPRPSALVRAQLPVNVLETRLASMFRVCKDSTVGCVSLLVDLFHQWMNVLLSIFKGQKRMAGSTFGDL